MDRSKLSIIVLLLLVAIVGIAYFAGVQNVRVGQRSVQTVSVQVTDPLYAPSTVTGLNLTYTSVGIHFTSGNFSGWAYYNATGILDLMQLQNYTYTLAQFAVPYNATVDQAELDTVYSNLTTGHTAQQSFIIAGHLYTHVNNTRVTDNNSTVLLDLSPTIIPVVNQTTLYFGVRPELSAASIQSNVQMIGTVAPINSTAKGIFRRAPSNLTITSASITESGNRTRISITLSNNGSSQQTVEGMVVLGNFTVQSGITNASILQGITSAVANSNTLQRVLPANLTSQISSTTANSSGILGSIGSIFNKSGFLSSLSGKVGGAISNISSTLHLPSVINLNSSLTSLNASSYRSVLIQTLSNATHGRLTTSYLSNQTVGGLSSIVNNLGGIGNSSLEGNLAVSLVKSEYNQYVNRTLVFSSQVRKLGPSASSRRRTGAWPCPPLPSSPAARRDMCSPPIRPPHSRSTGP